MIIKKLDSSIKDNSITKEAIKTNYFVKKSKFSAIWGSINIFGSIFLIYDLILMKYYDRDDSFAYYFECFLVMIFLSNSIYYIIKYIQSYWHLKTIEVSPIQKELLRLEDDSYFKIKSPEKSILKKASSTPISTPMCTSATSWQSNSTSNTDSILSVLSTSWLYHRNVSKNDLSERAEIAGSKNVSLNENSESYRAPIPDTSGVDFIDNETSLKKYLQDYENHERLYNLSMNSDNIRSMEEQNKSVFNSFWNMSAAQACNDVLSFLNSSRYQLATQAIAKVIGSPVTNGHTDGNSWQLNETKEMEIWQEIKINVDTLTNWHSNLRMWISKTILDRLVDEIDQVNASLTRHGFSDIQIGMISLERLRKTAQTQQCMQFIPTLNTLIAFLEVTNNQEYLVKRIRELAKGGCISEYRWNSGGTYNNKPWDNNLITDAALIMHLLSTYLDSQLLPLPTNPEVRPFSTKYLVKGIERNANTASVAIREISEKPPHYDVLVKNKIYEISKGRNNLFHVWLLFLCYQNKEENGMIGRVNLGKSGINILWVIDQ